MVPTYLLSVSILSPVMLKLGVDEVAAHLFFIYWGVLGAVTPPTCEAAVISAGIAKGDWLKTGWYAMGLGAVAFCLPYFIVLDPALVGRAAPADVAFAAVTGFIGAIVMSYGIFGWKDSPLNPLLRCLFLVGGTMLLFPGAVVTGIGAAITAVTLVLNKLRDRIALSEAYLHKERTAGLQVTGRVTDYASYNVQPVRPAVQGLFRFKGHLRLEARYFAGRYVRRVRRYQVQPAREPFRL